jgi:hypothetical protein
MEYSDDVLTSAVKQIADEICDAARQDGDAVYWLTSAFTAGTSEWRSVASIDLYSGVAGIALFLLEAAVSLGDGHYRDFALAGLRWCERTATERGSYGLYAGRIGVSLVFLRAAHLTGDLRHQGSAMRLAAGNDGGIDSAAGNDLLYGRAGTVLGLLQLHGALQDDAILTSAQAWLSRLVREARWVADGVCWDPAWQNIKGLCGLSHGTAGIALVLLEASRYLRQPSYARLAHEAMRYEAAAFDPAEETWSDFRKLGGRSPEQFETEFGNVPDAKLVVPGVMDAWCHGAPGIGLSRVRAFELEGGAHLGDLRIAVDRTVRKLDAAEQRSYTLCHGACGNAMLLLEAAPILRQPELVAIAQGVGQRAAEAKLQGRMLHSGYALLHDFEDPSLMMGTAGVGWYLLRLMKDIGDVLLPRVTGTGVTGSEYSEGEISLGLTRGLFPQSLAAIERRSRQEAETFFSCWRGRDESIDFIFEKSQDTGARDEASLEREKLRLRDTCRSFALAYVARWRAARDAPALRAEDLRGVPLSLSEFVSIWQPESETGEPQLLAIRNGDTVSTGLNALAAAVLSSFESPRTIEDVTESIAAGMGVDPDRVRPLVEDQILDACRNGIIDYPRWASSAPTAAENQV